MYAYNICKPHSVQNKFIKKKLEYNRVNLRKHREKMKALHGTTYVGSQKESVLKYNKKVKELSGKFPSPFNPFRIKNIENKENTLSVSKG